MHLYLRLEDAWLLQRVPDVEDGLGRLVENDEVGESRLSWVIIRWCLLIPIAADIRMFIQCFRLCMDIDLRSCFL